MDVNVAIDPALTARYPQIRLGCLAYEARVEKENPALWAEMEARVVPETLRLLEERGLTGLEGIRSSREAYKAFGRNPTRYRVSSESLIRRIRQGHPLYRVNTVVDANNLISVETAISAGSYDLDRLQGAVTLRVGQPGQGYEGIGKDYIDMEKMLLLADDLGPFGSPTSDSHRAMIGLDSTHILTVLYCFSAAIGLEAALERAAGQLEQYAGARGVRRWIVTA